MRKVKKVESCLLYVGVLLAMEQHDSELEIERLESARYPNSWVVLDDTAKQVRTYSVIHTY